MTAFELLPRLDGVRSRGTGKWMARCPSHQDNNPSLAVTEGERGLLLKCWAGCTLDEITAALGIAIKDLFFDAPTPDGHRTISKPVKLDLVALAFRFELGALDRRLRAEHVKRIVNAISINELPDNDLDRLVDAVGCAYADIERAEMFERVADVLRAKDFVRKKATMTHAA